MSSPEAKDSLLSATSSGWVRCVGMTFNQYRDGRRADSLELASALTSQDQQRLPCFSWAPGYRGARISVTPAYTGPRNDEGSALALPSLAADGGSYLPLWITIEPPAIAVGSALSMSSGSPRLLSYTTSPVAIFVILIRNRSVPPPPVMLPS